MIHFGYTGYHAGRRYCGLPRAVAAESSHVAYLQFDAPWLIGREFCPVCMELHTRADDETMGDEEYHGLSNANANATTAKEVIRL